jgi:hypothetical protein
MRHLNFLSSFTNNKGLGIERLCAALDNLVTEKTKSLAYTQYTLGENRLKAWWSFIDLLTDENPQKLP